MIGLEEELIAAYRELTPDLDAPDLVRTAAQVAASHAQMLVALRVLAGEPDATTAQRPPGGKARRARRSSDGGSRTRTTPAWSTAASS